MKGSQLENLCMFRLAGLKTGFFSLLQKDTPRAGLRLSHGAATAPPGAKGCRAAQTLLGVYQQRQGTLSRLAVHLCQVALRILSGSWSQVLYQGCLGSGWCGFSGLSADLQTKGSPVRFPVRARAWVAGQVPSRGCVRGNHTLMFLSFPSPLSKNK